MIYYNEKYKYYAMISDIKLSMVAVPLSSLCLVVYLRKEEPVKWAVYVGL